MRELEADLLVAGSRAAGLTAAIPIQAGDIGTNGGVRTNEHAQVLDESALPIGGLYATGNTTASVMGHSYPGAGATLGPAMAFGYIAAQHACGRGVAV